MENVRIRQNNWISFGCHFFRSQLRPFFGPALHAAACGNDRKSRTPSRCNMRKEIFLPTNWLRKQSAILAIGQPREFYSSRKCPNNQLDAGNVITQQLGRKIEITGVRHGHDNSMHLKSSTIDNIEVLVGHLGKALEQGDHFWTLFPHSQNCLEYDCNWIILPYISELSMNSLGASIELVSRRNKKKSLNMNWGSTMIGNSDTCCVSLRLWWKETVLAEIFNLASAFQFFALGDG